ncbi:MAG TPA: hypothetical protein EYQ62_12285 [Verrucomicrobiales bacterium]|jgi:hypothetical protein|nr:hypothetical protein [Verrucomicrobiales bacterium]
MNLKLITLFALVATLALGADKKAPPVAGTYKGEIEGDQATVILKADGSIIVRPSAEQPKFALRGKWKREGDTITAKLKDPTGDEATGVFKINNGDLVLVKIIEPNGEVKEFGMPQFKRNKRLADKGPAGVYVGWFDDEHLSVQVKPDGDFTVTPFEDLKGGPIFTGKWKATERGLRATLTSKDEEGEEEATVDFVTTPTGLAILKVVDGDGEVETFDTRLKRQKRGGKAPKKN